jgi:hypothetical protein
MILGMEIGLAIAGLLALIRGRMTISSTKVVEGTPAYLLGILAMCPLPLAFMVGFVYGVANARQGNQQIGENEKWILLGIEAALVIGIGVLIFIIGIAVATNPTKSKRRKRRHEDNYEDDDDEYDDRRPLRKHREDDYEDDDDPPPRKRSKDDYEDDDDRDEKRRPSHR